MLRMEGALGNCLRLGVVVGGCLQVGCDLVVVSVGGVVLPVEALGSWRLRWLCRGWVVVASVMKGV